MHGCLSMKGRSQKKECSMRHDERFEERQRHDAQIARATVRDLTSLASERERITIGSSSNPLVLALRAVGHAQGIEIRDVPLDIYGRDPIQAIAETSGVRIRKALLQGRWWNDEFGPLLGFTADTGEPVALLPARSRLSREHRYDVFDLATGARRAVDGPLAAKLSSTAYTMYRSLPEQARPLELVRFALSGLSKDVLVGVLCGVAATLLGMLIPQATAIVVDYAIPNADRSLLLNIALGLGAAAFGMLLFEFAQAASLLRIETLAAAAVQAGLWNRLLKLRPSFFRGFTAGDLHSRAASIGTIRQRLGGATLTNIFSATLAFLNAALMLYYSPILGFTVLVVAAIAVAVIGSSGVLISRVMPVLQNIDGHLSGLMVQLVDAAPKLRVAGAEHRAFAHWAESYGRKQRLNQSVVKLQDRIRLTNSVLPLVALAILYATAAGFLTTAGRPFSLGRFLAFNAALAAFLTGITTLSETGISVLNVPSLWGRARTILDAEPEVASNATASIKLKGAVKVERVTFRYRDDGPLTLDEVTIEARPSECIALAGPSGGGKSTILNLLLGFEKPLSGAIYYDGHDLKGLNVTNVRRQIGVVMQDNKIMAGSIFENIACGSLSTVTDAWESARAAGLADDIEKMPMGMHTVISEAGTNLSGGQRQRLLIARALILKPSVLILDEATSALDNRTQAIVMKNLDSLKVTRILVAHRLSTIRQADRIYVIDGGRIVQTGTFDRLSREDGLFARLMARQMA
jgi:NHLM bacteriocin system ABC transporter ATP-binding protein